MYYVYIDFILKTIIFKLMRNIMYIKVLRQDRQGQCNRPIQ